MPEQLYLLMQQHGPPDPDGSRRYLSVIVNDATVLTREVAERAAIQDGTPGPRFLIPWQEGRGLDKFADPARSIPMGLMPPNSLWRRGQPTSADIHGVLKQLVDGAVSPEPDTVLLPISQAVGVATERIGPGDAEDVQPHFDGFVMEFEGRIDEDAYAVSIRRLLLG